MQSPDARAMRSRALSTTCAAALLIALAGAAPAAIAQDEPEPATEESSERIVVTGSRIQRQDYTANSPIVTVDTETFDSTSTIGISTILNQLPQFVPALDQFTAADIQPTATNTVGSSTVSLRGLGSNRSLVLIDGRRAPPVNASLAVDTDAIASSAIQRVEIISGGASAVYGADAIAGVVNFILKDNYEGFEIESRYGVSELGDNTEFQISSLFGANFDNGRGNVMMSLEHSTRGAAEEVERDWAREELANPFVNPTDFWFSEPFIGRRPGGAFPDQAAVDALFPEAVPCDPDGFGPLPAPSTCPEGSVPRTASFYINPTLDGTGTIFSGVRTFGGATGAAGAYKYDGPFESPDAPGAVFRKFHPDGSIGQNNVITNLSRPLERYSGFARGRYDITDNVSAIAQTMFARTRAETLSQYTAALGSNAVIIPYGDEIYAPSVDENGNTRPEYLPGGAFKLDTLPGGVIGDLVVPEVTCGPVGGCSETYVFPLPLEARALLNSRGAGADQDYTLNTALDFVGRRRNLTESVMYQLLFGFEGELWNDWTWDATLSHSETESSNDLYGDVSRERYRAVASAPNFGRNFQAVGNADFGGQRAGQARCTTGLPLIAKFQVSEDCLEAIGSITHNDQNIVQNAFEANLAGDLFELPAGTLASAVGTSYREYDFEYNVDNLQGFTSFIENSSGIRPVDPTSGYYSVYEAYGELLVPVLSDLPLIQQLNLELGGRFSDYSTVGEVTTVKALADWTITDWARVRGGYNKATRAPNIAELFQARTALFQGSAAQFGDQCSQNNTIAPYGTNPESNVNGAEGAAFALDLCRAIMGPAAASFYYDERDVADQPDPGSAGTPNTIGNPNVDAETADTYTVGLVLRSPFENNAFLSGFSGSIDYFTIDLNDMIASKNPDDVYQECLDPAINTAADPSIPACKAIIRDLVTGAALNVDTGFTNEGSSTTTGVDVQVDWRGELADLGLDMIPGGVSLNMLASFNIENTTQASENAAEIDWKGTRGCALGLGCMGYDYRVFTTVSYFAGPFAASLRWRHYPSIKSGAAATNPATTAIGVPKAYDIFSLSGSYRLRDGVVLRGGVENLLDIEPPLAGGLPNDPVFPRASTRAGGGTYDPIGRRYFVGVTATF